MSLLSVLTAAGTPVTDTTAETSMGGYTFPANFWQSGKVVKFSGLVRVIDSNSTDTLLVKVKVGSTAIITTAAVDVADGDVCAFSGVLACRDNPGATSTIVAQGFYGPADASGTAALEFGAVVGSLNTAAALAFDVTATWSVAHADNECQLESLVFEELI
jgi:hypothetical protein